MDVPIYISKSSYERLEEIREYLEDQLDVDLSLSKVLNTIIEQVVF